MSDPSSGSPRSSRDQRLCGRFVIEPADRAGFFRLPLLRSPAALMLAGVLAITGFRLLWLVFQPADLYPDEAQYWFWAQHPALGYYSKPPLVAWLIALTTGLFGESEFAIRLSAPLLHAGTAIFVYAIGSRLYDRRVGLWSALAYASLPGRLDLRLHHLDRCAVAAVLGGGALRIHPSTRRRRVGLVARRRGRLRARAARKIRDGVLDLLGARLMSSWFRAERRHFGPLLAAIGIALAPVFAEFLVELEQRVRQLCPCEGQCGDRTSHCSTPTPFSNFSARNSRYSGHCSLPA